MTLLTTYALATSKPFLQAVTIAIVTSAQAVKAEAPATPNHALRSKYADVVLASPATAAVAMAYDIAIQTGGTVAAPPTDAQVQTASDSVWNAFSQVP